MGVVIFEKQVEWETYFEVDTIPTTSVEFSKYYF